MVVGSLASSFHAEPRTTQDIDIVIDPTPRARTVRQRALIGGSGMHLCMRPTSILEVSPRGAVRAPALTLTCIGLLALDVGHVPVAPGLKAELAVTR